MSYILIRRLPDGSVRSGGTLFEDVAAATRSVAILLSGNMNVLPTDAQKFADTLAEQPVGTIWGHPLGYDFRILAADLTGNGVPITPRLRVMVNDMWHGTVWPDQFMGGGLIEPGGKFFDGFYLVCKKGDEKPYAKYNGERMSTKEIV